MDGTGIFGVTTDNGLTPLHVTLIILSAIVALFLTDWLTPLAMRIARAAGVMDQPHARRVHTKPTPRWGGLAIYTAFTITVLVLMLFRPTLNNPRVWGILLGATLITALGALDDKYSIPAKWKLLGQVLIACIPPLFGVRVLAFFDVYLEAEHYRWLSYGLTVVWIVAVTNTINLIDGLDGLAAGISGFACLTFAALGLLQTAMGAIDATDTLGLTMLAAAMVGACIGFLRWNFYPARVFMGDAGSHFLGYTIAALAILQNWKVATGAALAVPLLALAVPIFDTIFAIVRRARRGQPIFSPDKGHLHHRLLNMGLNQRQVVLTIYLLTAIGCLLALLLAHARMFK
jgi:UDP-GlcNAc:undecaprenyl-phosphate/decaprenyl-phosphate GlcNAc-1-phosphate transferase